MTSTLFGIDVYTAPEMTELVNVARSPSRALRRWRQGKRATNPMEPRPSTKVYLIGGKALVLHPEGLRKVLHHIPLRDEGPVLIDMATRQDRTVVAPVQPSYGKTVLDRMLDGPPMCTEFLDRLITGQRALMEGTERRLLGMDTEQVEPSTLTLTKIRRLLNGGWPAADLPPRKEQC